MLKTRMLQQPGMCWRRWKTVSQVQKRDFLCVKFNASCHLAKSWETRGFLFLVLGHSGKTWLPHWVTCLCSSSDFDCVSDFCVTLCDSTHCPPYVRVRNGCYPQGAREDVVKVINVLKTLQRVPATLETPQWSECVSKATPQWSECVSKASHTNFLVSQCIKKLCLHSIVAYCVQ